MSSVLTLNSCLLPSFSSALTTSRTRELQPKGDSSVVPAVCRILPRHTGVILEPELTFSHGLPENIKFTSSFASGTS